jgi:orotate phosphoribosyltransferase
MESSSNLAENIAESLLRIEAVTLRPKQPFTWTSGLKSPIYCDNRLTMSYPEIRGSISDAFAGKIRDTYPDAQVIAGTATAGIPHAAWVSQKMNLPMIYIRDKAKGHGKENLIEGVIRPGQKVVVIEDLISTGGSSLKAALAVKEAGGDVLAVLAIFSYELSKAVEAFKQHDIPLHTLSNYSALLEVALRMGKIEEADLSLLQSWRTNPSEYEKSFQS